MQYVITTQRRLGQLGDAAGAFNLEFPRLGCRSLNFTIYRAFIFDFSSICYVLWEEKSAPMRLSLVLVHQRWGDCVAHVCRVQINRAIYSRDPTVRLSETEGGSGSFCALHDSPLMEISSSPISSAIFLTEFSYLLCLLVIGSFPFCFSHLQSVYNTCKAFISIQYEFSSLTELSRHLLNSFTLFNPLSTQIEYIGGFEGPRRHSLHT